MDSTEKVMVACLLLSEGGNDGEVREFIAALEEGIELGEKDSVDMHRALMERLAGSVPDGPAGAVIRLMKAKREHDESCRKFGMMTSGIAKALQLLEHPAGSGLAAKVLAARVMALLGEARLGSL